MDSRPIGIIDSGVGGLSVWREFIKSMPNENVIYFADTANCPYGPRSQQEIIDLVKDLVTFLIDKNVKMIIVACNTATAAAIDYLRLNYSVPFIGMEPAVKPAALNSKTKSIAVLATEGTFNGKLYLETSKKYASDVDLHIKVGDKLVEIVENNKINESETLAHLIDLMAPLIEKNIDYLVLGCTHYPFLTDKLKQILPSYITIVDPAPAVVKQAIRILEENDLLNKSDSEPNYVFYSSGNPEILEKFVVQITGKSFSVNGKE